MIDKIGIQHDKRNLNNQLVKKSQKTVYASTPEQNVNIAGKLSANYFVPFTGKAMKSKQEIIEYYSDTQAKELFEDLSEIAREDGTNQITTMHVLQDNLEEALDYVDDVLADKEDHSLENSPIMVQTISADISDQLFFNKDMLKKIRPVLEEYADKAGEIIETQVKKNPDAKSITLSSDLIDGIMSIREKSDETVSLYHYNIGALSAKDKTTKDFVTDLYITLQEKAMVRNPEVDGIKSFSAYDKQAQNIMRKVALGGNVMLTFDYQKEDVRYFLDTLHKLYKDKGDEKTKFVEISADASAEFLAYKLLQMSKDKKTNYVVSAIPSRIIYNAAQQDSEGSNSGQMPAGLIAAMANQPENVKYIFYDTKTNYYNFSESAFKYLYSSFEENSMPTLSAEQMKQALEENPSLMKDIDKSFSPEAIGMVVNVASQMDGVFPDKALLLMKNISGLYPEKTAIGTEDVQEFLEEAGLMLKKSNDDSSVEVVFDTGKRLKDIVGKESTKKEVASIVKQIKSNKMGTKGTIIYSQDGTAGSGRRFTAKAIAGEAGVPFVEVNTMDFGTKDVDLFGGGALSPEASIKKLFSVLTAQAEANPNKSLVLFIENFEYFSVGEYVSLYHQKAMAQLLREMDKADKAGLNILVVGSVANPELIGEATMKSFKFNDSIEVSSPAHNKLERKQVIEHAFKDAKIKLAGNAQERQKILDYAAQISDSASFIELKQLVKKSQSVALERGHKLVDKSDITEAFLQITTGRPAIRHIEQHDKEVVASHECGHATNLEVMNNVARTLGKPWHIPDKVNFITLDPRGDYGGAVYHGDDANSEFTFESVFARIVCSFGGNSAESKFFNFDGSWGITGDMQSARGMAELMVKYMGLGHQTGKMSIGPYEDLSDNMKRMIEDDERVILNNAKLTSEMITEVYSDFNKWFTAKYAPLVGTGDCLFDGDEFRKALKEWRNSQSPQKQRELDLCDQTIVRIMEATKKGIAIRKQ